ncbi:MAG: DUF5996 family protein [Vicinamibacterales bacterium]
MTDTHTHLDTWPALPLAAWADTCATLHLWFQIVGKVRLTLTPWLNHSWHAPLYVTPRGLTTSAIPHDTRIFDVEFDFVAQRLYVRVSDGQETSFPLEPQPVSAFHARLLDELNRLGIPAVITRMPNEIPGAVAFDRDEAPRAYDPESAARFWRVLVQADRVFKRFRARFIGKCSPVHFFWGAPDLAVTRFSGRTAPAHPGGVPNLADWVTREAYSHEVSSCGFWPGGGAIDYPVFYSYAYPAPPGFAAARVQPEGATFSEALGEFLLPYDVVRTSATPDETLLTFLQSTYDAAADLGKWDRAALERREDPRVANDAPGAR